MKQLKEYFITINILAFHIFLSDIYMQVEI